MLDPVPELEWYLPKSLSIWSPIQNYHDIKLMGVGLYSCYNLGVTYVANIYGAIAEDEVEDFP